VLFRQIDTVENSGLVALLILICVVALLVRIERSTRWPQLDPWRERWRPLERRTVRYVRSAPFTYVFLFVLLITTWVFQTSSPSTARNLLLERSTNLHQLGHDPMRVLVASAFWLSGTVELLVWLILFTLVLAPVERWIGSARTAFVFAFGHIGATLLTAAGLWLAIDYEITSRHVTHAVDVGVSYGFFAVAAVLAFRFSGRRLALYLAVLIGYLGIAAAVAQGFTDFGHLTALALGFLVAPLVTLGRARSRSQASQAPEQPSARSSIP
jgi:membrane associated rhomboid family serine protease